ncbi:MAG: response regulator transcription factor [Anaerolineales bacterium]|jgi:DNA-binding NarL/FixJ family response regulator
MKILTVDDHVLFREGLASLLSEHPDFTVVGEAGTAREAVAKALELKPDLVLLDLNLPDGSGLDVIKSILSRRPETKIVILTIHEAEDLLLAAIRNGAIGYILKNTPVSELLLSLRALGRGEAALSREMTTRLVNGVHQLEKTLNKDDPELEVLTSREMEVLQLLGARATNREIADQLVIAKNTVKVHVHNILKKLGLKSRLKAGRLARRKGLTPYPNNHLDLDQ